LKAYAGRVLEIWLRFYCSAFSYSGNSEEGAINVYITDESRELKGEVNNKPRPCAIQYVLFSEVERISVYSRCFSLLIQVLAHVFPDQRSVRSLSG